jgi:hypothetical protein
MVQIRLMDVAGRLLFLVWKRIGTLGAKYRFIWLQVRWHNEHRKPLSFLTLVFHLLSSDEVLWGGRWKASKRLERHCTVFLFTGCSGVFQSVYWPDSRLYREIVVWLQIGLRNFYLSQCLLAGFWAPSLTARTGGSRECEADQWHTSSAKIYDIFINCNWFVTRWQYTFTHKQYIEQHK